MSLVVLLLISHYLRVVNRVAEKLMQRIVTLEKNIADVNQKIDLIDSKIDNIQQIRARKRAQD